MGFAANKEPQLVIPSAIAVKETAKVGDNSSMRITKGVEDLDFFIGDEAFDATGYSIKVSFNTKIAELSNNSKMILLLNLNQQIFNSKLQIFLVSR